MFKCRKEPGYHALDQKRPQSDKKEEETKEPHEK